MSVLVAERARLNSKRMKTLDNENYEWAIIGSSSPNYLWILSRKPQIEDELYQKLIKRIENRGYDLGKLILVEQK